MSQKKHIVVLTGAGISAESGLKTFRDGDGLWNGYNVYDVATPGAWKKKPKMVLDFYNDRRRDVLNAQPNAAHIGLATLEKDFEVTIITQNIDDLHERAGSTKIVHLHGEIFKVRSELDETLIYPTRVDIEWGDLATDGAQLRPCIVWFEEPVPMIEKAMQLVQDCDLFAVIGTSLQVYPAASLLHYTAKGLPIFIIDKKIPEHNYSGTVTIIEKPASEGIHDFQNLLKPYL